MNPLDTMKAGAPGVVEKFTGEDPKLFQEFTKLVQNMPDGFTGLMKQFKDRGLGDVVDSFTGKGPKVEIKPEHMLKGFGSEQINAFATNTGLDPKIVPEKLAGIFPKIFEQFNPIAAAIKP